MSAIIDAQKALFGEGGLGVTNIKLFPGSSRDVTAERLAQQILLVIKEEEQGELVTVEVDAL